MVTLDLVPLVEADEFEAVVELDDEDEVELDEEDDDDDETNYPAGQVNEQAPLANVKPVEHVVQAEAEVH